MNLKEAFFDYVIRLADNASILGHRLAEWCGHGPVLEQDIALSNISLDFIGQARMLYQYAAEIQGQNKTEDDLAYLRDTQMYKNAILVEQPNQDWGYTIIRQFLYDTYNLFFHQELCKSKDPQIAAYAQKALKEISYHYKWSAEWVIRLGDGTDESHKRAQQALDDYYLYLEELVTPNEVDEIMAEEEIGVDLVKIAPMIHQKIAEVIAESTLELPKNSPKMFKYGKNGYHSEHLGYILAEMQYLQRTYPGAEW